MLIGSERGLPGLSVCLGAGSRIKNGGREWLFEERARGDDGDGIEWLWVGGKD